MNDLEASSTVSRAEGSTAPGSSGVLALLDLRLVKRRGFVYRVRFGEAAVSLGHGCELLIEAMQGLELFVREALDVDEPVARALHRRDQLVQLQLDRVGVLVLRLLDQEDHQEGDDGRAGVDDEL